MKHLDFKKQVAKFFIFFASAGCTLGPLQFNQGSYSSGGLQVVPSSTTVSTNQSAAFQASGGTPPYQYQVSGVGTIDQYGNFQSGSSAGQAQIQITDSNNNTGMATVSVVQSTAQYPSYSDEPQGYWSATTAAKMKKNPQIRGQTLAVDERQIDTKGDAVESKYVVTGLKHPIVRVDKLIEDKQVVATRAVVEDQFLVTLQPGHSESDLSNLVTGDKAHISKTLKPGSVFLVSMDAPVGGVAISKDFLTSRDQLKKDLRKLGAVTPNFVSRSPAAASSN